MQTVTWVRALAGAISLGRLEMRPVDLVLGARQLVQAEVVARTGWHALSAGVDLLHGATMLPLLAVRPWRRFAVTQLLTATVLVALETRASD